MPNDRMVPNASSICLQSQAPAKLAVFVDITLGLSAVFSPFFLYPRLRLHFR